MLEENKALRMRLHSLTIFRGLLEDPVVSRLAALLHAQPSDAEACADAGGVSLGVVEYIAGEVGQVCGHGLDALVAFGLHHDGRADLLELFAGAFPI